MVTLYTKDYCPFCTQAKTLLQSISVDFEEVDITDDDELFREIFQKSGMRTVPQIFVWDACLGGYSDIAELHGKNELIATIKKLEQK